MTPLDILYLFFLSILLVILTFASKEDLETHEVSKKKQLAILIACIPLIIMNLQNLTYVHLVYIVLTFGLYYLGMGGADIKVLIPLSLTLSLAPLIIFTILFNILGLIHGIWLGGWSKIKGIPLIPSITVGYVLTLLWIM